ncbi:MAG TPA: SpoIID/LytB domain-containing protein [Actinomycetota bacterium]|nr:SpoIID/LytB domain-containing protein [Actinomycetota bacterium]
MKKPTLVLVLILVLAPAQAGADTTFRFRGGGWGHGIGLSQYGAYGLAEKGWSRNDILTWYYAGTSVQAVDPPKDTYRVGLLQNRGSFTLTAQDAAFDFALSSAPSDPIHSVGAGRTRRVVISGGRYRIYDGDKLVGAFGDADDHLLAIRRDGSRIKVEEWGYRVGRGRLQFRIVSGARAHLVARVAAETYLYGLGEVPSSWPAKVLEAQAIAARSYADRIVASRSRESSCACDIYASTRDQHYMGWDKEGGYLGERWVKAVDDTARRVVAADGAPVITYYSASSGGWTEAVHRVWGGASRSYLRARCDPGDFTSANGNRTWSKELTGREAASLLRARRGWGISRVTSISVLDRGPSGYVLKVRIRGRNASGDAVSFTTSGEGLRSGLALKSARVWVNANRLVTGKIRSRYDSLRCRPGLAKSARTSTNGGVWQRFAKGRIYSKDDPGTHWVYGLVLRRYLDANGPRGSLGYPTTEVVRLSDGRLRTRFQNGVITCNPSTGRCSLKRT